VTLSFGGIQGSAVTLVARKGGAIQSMGGRQGELIEFFDPEGK
jgi:hypothetical protein